MGRGSEGVDWLVRIGSVRESDCDLASLVESVWLSSGSSDAFRLREVEVLGSEDCLAVVEVAWRDAGW